MYPRTVPAVNHALLARIDMQPRRVTSKSASNTLHPPDSSRMMYRLAQLATGFISDILRLGLSFFRSSTAIRAENLVLRRKLAKYLERSVKARKVDALTRISLALFTRLFDWREAVVLVRPATIIRWHRLGWRLFWRGKCRIGRPPIPVELRALIRRMPQENPLWGEERIANELLVKLDNCVSPCTVRKYMRKPPVG